MQTCCRWMQRRTFPAHHVTCLSPQGAEQSVQPDGVTHLTSHPSDCTDCLVLNRSSVWRREDRGDVLNPQIYNRMKRKNTSTMVILKIFQSRRKQGLLHTGVSKGLILCLSSTSPAELSVPNGTYKCLADSLLCTPRGEQKPPFLLPALTGAAVPSEPRCPSPVMEAGTDFVKLPLTTSLAEILADLDCKHHRNYCSSVKHTKLFSQF